MTTWIPTTPNPDGSLTINGVTYSDDVNHEIYEGYVLKNDENHSGRVYFTAEMAEKYGLTTEVMDEEAYQSWVNDGGDKRYTHSLCVFHYWGTINGDGELINGHTPFGDCYSTELYCHMNEIDPAFFDEDDKDVLVWGWSDG